jgi:hypothetical protein
MGVAVPNGVLLLLLGWLFIVVALRANDVDVIPDVLFKPQEVWPPFSLASFSCMACSSILYFESLDPQRMLAV